MLDGLIGNSESGMTIQSYSKLRWGPDLYILAQITLGQELLWEGRVALDEVTLLQPKVIPELTAGN